MSFLRRTNFCIFLECVSKFAESFSVVFLGSDEELGFDSKFVFCFFIDYTANAV